MEAPQSPTECPQDLLATAMAEIRSDEGEGLSALDRLLTEYAGDARLHFLKGSVLAGLKRYDEAGAAMRTAVNLAPGFHIARFQLGLLNLTSGNLAAAKAIWKPLSGLATDHPLRLFAEGLQHLAADQFAEAEAALRMGLVLNTENLPLNHDMRLILDSIPQGPDTTPDQGSSATHHLLQQYAERKTRH